MSNNDYEVTYGPCGTVKSIKKRENSYSQSFHKGGYDHDTYREQGRYVESLGNQWASENFNATKPYFA